ncbi:unnamed protein product [Brugia timori]|uniref:Phage protein n=1 Tax=Brugia timori TaxID=42155 RepID=A0A0R3Q918_9BILA|nr:unnamed protein product [Brugia timori]
MDTRGKLFVNIWIKHFSQLGIQLIRDRCHNGIKMPNLVYFVTGEFIQYQQFSNSEWMWYAWKVSNSSDVIQYVSKYYKPSVTYADFAQDVRLI